MDFSDFSPLFLEESATRAVAPPAKATVDAPWAALEVRAPCDGAAALAVLQPILAAATVRWPLTEVKKT